MHQRDYILRIIEQVGAALAEIRRRILGGADSVAVTRALADTAGRAGLSVEILRSATLDTLYMFAAHTGEVDPTRCWLMAEILYLDGLQATVADSPADARDSLVKARALYDMIRPGGGMIVGFPEAAERIAEIDRLLDERPPTPSGDPRIRSRRMSANARRSLVGLHGPKDPLDG